MSLRTPTPALRRRPIPGRPAEADPAAFARLYARHEQELSRYCRSILRNEEDARDALQNTMVKAFAALQKEQRELDLRPWLFRIAHNEAISLIRRRPDTTELDPDVGGRHDAVQDEVETRERLTELRADLQDLPEKQRGALVMRELSGLSHEEIATALGTSPRAVKQTIYEARCSLNDCATGRAMRCDDVQQALSDADGRVVRSRAMRSHLRTCRACTMFRVALTQRPADLAALSPALPLLGVGGVLAALNGASATGILGAGTAGAAGVGSAGGLSGGGVAGGSGVAAAGAAEAAGVAGGAAAAGAEGLGLAAGGAAAGGGVAAGGGGALLGSGIGASVLSAGASKLAIVAATVTLAGGGAVVVGGSGPSTPRDARTPSVSTRAANGARTTSGITPGPVSRAVTAAGATTAAAAAAGRESSNRAGRGDAGGSRAAARRRTSTGYATSSARRTARAGVANAGGPAVNGSQPGTSSNAAPASAGGAASGGRGTGDGAATEARNGRAAAPAERDRAKSAAAAERERAAEAKAAAARKAQRDAAPAPAPPAPAAAEATPSGDRAKAPPDD